MGNKNGFLIGSSSFITLTSKSTIYPSYTGLVFNGNYVLDTISLLKTSLTDSQVLNMSVSKMPQTWTANTIMLANMQNTVDGSNVFGMTSPLLSWEIYRQGINDESMKKVCSVPANINTWTDYKAEGNKEYRYLIFGKSASQISHPIVTEVIKPSFYGYYLIGSDADNPDPNINGNVPVFKFDLNLTSDKVTVNNAATYLQNYTKFDSAVIMDRNFKSGSFTSLLVPQTSVGFDLDGKQRWIDNLNELRVFLHDKNYKYLKNRSGEILKVLTESSNNTFDYQFMEGTVVDGNQPITVTIGYTEIGDVD